MNENEPLNINFYAKRNKIKSRLLYRTNDFCLMLRDNFAAQNAENVL